MENHLIIGLGGTGGKILAAYRRLIFEQFNGNIKPDNLWIEYLYVDSSEKDLKETGGIWNILGTSIALDEGSQVSIKAGNLKEYIENIDNYPYLQNWIGKIGDWKNIINDPKVMDGAAGQKRRLGRFLFANKAADFNAKVNDKVRKLQQNPQGQNITFHICCGLAGGTGSGSIVDAVAQIRKTYSDTSIYRIIPYLLLPEEIPNISWATTSNYQPNGYSALLELNAMDYQLFNPWDIGEKKFEPTRLESKLPFYSAYIITEQNKSNVRFDVDKVIPANIAEFLYQKTVAVNQGKDLSKAKGLMERAETGENPDYGSYGYHHSFKFITFGIKRLAIPRQEIKEYCTYSYGRQAVLQMLYNNPSNEIGFQEEPFPNDDFSEVTKSSNLGKWNLSINHICLSTAVLTNHKGENWRSINDEYKEIDIQKTTVLQNNVIPHNDKLVAIANITKDFYEKKFRPLGQAGGVAEFYKTKRKVGLTEIARQISKEIENDLFNMWAKGDKSLYQVSEMVRCLIAAETDQIDKFDKMISDAQSTISSKENTIRQLGSEWPRIGLFGKTLFTSKMDTISTEYTEAVKMKYIMMTWIEGYRFGKELLSEVVDGLKILKQNIDEASATLMDAQKILTAEINSKCNDDLVDADDQSIIIKYYDPLKVRELTLRSMKEKEFAAEQVSATRRSIINRMGENKTFGKVRKEIKVGGVIAQCETVCADQAENFFRRKEVTDVIGSNIIEKLEQEYSGNEIGMKEKLAGLLRHASVMCKYDETQCNDNSGLVMRKALLVILPEYKENPAFLSRIKEIIGELHANNNHAIIEGGNSNEIVIINLESNIALRYLQSVGVLRKTYDQLMNSVSGDTARFETHIEDFNTPLPSLYKKTVKEKEEELKNIQEEAIPYLLLANGIHIIQNYEEPETGLIKKAIILQDDDGFDLDPIILGKDLESCVSKITPEVLHTIKEHSEHILSTEYRHISKQKELIQGIAAQVNAIKEAHGGSVSNPVYTAFNKAGRELVSKIKNMNE